MPSISTFLIRLGTSLIPAKSVRKRVRRRLLDRERDAWLAKTVPAVRSRYEEHVRRCREKLARGERLRVCFLVCDVAMFSAESVYRAMRDDPRFKPFIAVAPRISRGEEFLRETLEKTMSELRTRYEDPVVQLYDPKTGDWKGLEDKTDIVFTSIVYDNQTDARFTAGPMSRYALVACVSYGYSGQLANDARRMIFLPQFALFWKLFITNPATLRAWRAVNPLLAYNLVLGGYSKMDRLTEAPVHPERPKTVLICPHHSLARGVDGVALSNFLRYSEFFLRLPELFPTVRFVFRPHPLLFPRLAREEWWGEARTKAYRAALGARPNVEFQQGGDYFETFANSDAMIHDCGSFLAEYFYTGCPQCYLLESPEVKEREFTDFGRALLDHVATAYSEEDVLAFLRGIVLGGVDTNAEERRKFAEREVCMFHPHAADRVLSEVVESLS